MEKIFVDCSLIQPTVHHEPSNDNGETVADRYKTAKFERALSLKVSHYMVVASPNLLFLKTLAM